jgi:hypothetical protein
MFLRLFWSGVQFALPIVFGAWLGPRFGPVTALVAIAIVAVLLALLGAWLLRGSTTGQINWRNHAAGWLMPQGWWLGSCQLPGMVASSVLFTVLAAAIGALAPDNLPLMGAFVLNGIALHHLLRTFRQHPAGTSGARTTGTLLLVVVLLIAAGLGLQFAGLPRLAALVAGGPPAVVGLLAGGWLLLLLTFGRNARWN